MTRRKFLIKFIETASAIITGSWLVIRKASPRKFVTAIRHKSYPGKLKPISNIKKIGKWSG